MRTRSRPDEILIRIVMALLLVPAGAARAGAQQDDLARLRRVYEPAQVTRIGSVIQAAERDGVPRTLLIGRALEGAAKGMSAPVVREAVEMYAGELRVAVDLLGPDTEPRSLEKAADAMRHGVGGTFLVSLAERDPHLFPVMIQVIEDLLHEGVGLDEATAIVQEASGRGLDGGQVLALPATLRRLIRGGASPADAVSSVRRSLRAGRPVGPPPTIVDFGRTDPPLSPKPRPIQPRIPTP